MRDETAIFLLILFCSPGQGALAEQQLKMIIFKLLLGGESANAFSRDTNAIFPSVRPGGSGRFVIYDAEDMAWILIKTDGLIAFSFPGDIGFRPEIGIPSFKIFTIEQGHPSMIGLPGSSAGPCE